MKKIALLFVFISIAFGESPKWYSSGELPGYSRDNYLIGLGEGKNPDEARTNAQAAISSQITVNIESTIQVFTKESRINDQSEFIDDFQRLNKSSTSEVLKGAEIIKTEASGGRYYAFAVLEKSQFFRGLRRELDLSLGIAESYLRQARGNIKHGNVFAAIENYSEAYDNILKHYSIKSVYDALSERGYDATWNIMPADIMGEIQNNLSGVSIEPVSGDNQQGINGAYLARPAVCQAFVKSETREKIPLQKVPVTVKSADKSVLFRLNTSSQGFFDFPVRAIPVDGNTGFLTAELRLASVSSSFKKYINKAECRITYSIASSPTIPVQLLITDESGKRLSKLERKVTKSLTSLNYSVSEEAILSLNGTVGITDEQEIDGFQGSQYMVKSELILELLGTESKERFSSASFSGTGLSPKSAADAFNASVMKIFVNKKNLSGLMSKASDKIDALLSQKSQEYFDKGKAFFAQNEYQKAVNELIKVSHPNKSVLEASQLIDTIRETLEKNEAVRIARITADKEKERALQLEKARLAAETEKARIEADIQKNIVTMNNQVLKIENILNPAYVGTIITVKGNVNNFVQIGVLKGFVLVDETASIQVLSSQEPKRGEELIVRGKLISDSIYGYYIHTNEQ